ncbi:MAG TPA: CDP-diacylglycerol--serine O-phosphatidyltransferase [Clostridia bacterium]|jgi:CDP-diacylglycerol--serine O-phosphatidyltransferase|nr:CDP-diacylglycerol--serine O-phosphatidyltransferase [Clostridia bacterium]
MLKQVVPNLITLTNLSLGIAALCFTMEAQYREASLTILMAMVFDGLDGRLARRFKTTSDFGKELDSLADLVSFGVAPALLVYAAVLCRYGLWGFCLAIFFALCGAIRLARFNILNCQTHFVGIPITFAGSFLAFSIFFKQCLIIYVYPLLVVLLSILMISNFKLPKL